MEIRYESAIFHISDYFLICCEEKICILLNKYFHFRRECMITHLGFISVDLSMNLTFQNSSQELQTGGRKIQVKCL